MNKAILTKFFGPGNRRPSRIKATDGDNSLFADYEHALHHSERHCYAAFQLAKKLGWSGFYVGGGTKDGFVFVCVSKDGRFPQASGQADHGRRAHDFPYGSERSDWFFLPDKDFPFGTIETVWAENSTSPVRIGSA